MAADEVIDGAAPAGDEFLAPGLLFRHGGFRAAQAGDQGAVAVGGIPGARELGSQADGEEKPVEFGAGKR